MRTTCQNCGDPLPSGSAWLFCSQECQDEHFDRLAEGHDCDLFDDEGDE